jgi:hypothetical protein
LHPDVRRRYVVPTHFLKGGDRDPAAAMVFIIGPAQRVVIDSVG